MTILLREVYRFQLPTRRDTQKLKTPLYLSRPDASKYVSGDLEKSILKLDPRSGHLTLIHNVTNTDKCPDT